MTPNDPTQQPQADPMGQFLGMPSQAPSTSIQDALNPIVQEDVEDLKKKYKKLEELRGEIKPIIDKAASLPINPSPSQALQKVYAEKINPRLTEMQAGLDRITEKSKTPIDVNATMNKALGLDPNGDGSFGSFYKQRLAQRFGNGKLGAVSMFLQDVLRGGKGMSPQDATWASARKDYDEARKTAVAQLASEKQADALNERTLRDSQSQLQGQYGMAKDTAQKQETENSLAINSALNAAKILQTDVGKLTDDKKAELNSSLALYNRVYGNKLADETFTAIYQSLRQKGMDDAAAKTQAEYITLSMEGLKRGYIRTGTTSSQTASTDKYGNVVTQTNNNGQFIPAGPPGGLGGIMQLLNPSQGAIQGLKPQAPTKFGVPINPGASQSQLQGQANSNPVGNFLKPQTPAATASSVSNTPQKYIEPTLDNPFPFIPEYKLHQKLDGAGRPVSIGSLAYNIANNKETMPKASSSNRGLAGEQELLRQVMAENPQWTRAQNEMAVPTEKAFAPGGKEYPSINAINTVLPHINALLLASNALSNGNYPVVNMIARTYSKATGDDPYTNYETILHRAGPEITKAYIPTAGGQTERIADAEDFSDAKSKKQIAGAIQTSAKLLLSKIAAQETGYRQGNPAGRNPLWNNEAREALVSIRNADKVNDPDVINYARDHYNGNIQKALAAIAAQGGK